jgi:hypothetical protein
MRRQNHETCSFEIRSAWFDSDGLPRTIRIVTVVKGERDAEMLVDTLMRHRTEEEKQTHITFYMKAV